MRLDRLKQQYGPQIELRWIGYPLVHRPEEPRYFDDHHVDEWLKANREEPDLEFRRWPEGAVLPYSSFPALVTARSAQRQGESAFQSLHERLFHAYFTECRDISQYSVLLELATEAGLDPEMLARDLVNQEFWNEVLSEYREALRESIRGIPTVKVGDDKGQLCVVGEIDDKKYKKLIDWFLMS